MIRPPGIESGAFVVTPDSVWYARGLLLFSASAQTDTRSKSFLTVLLCRRWKHMTILRMVIIHIIVIIVIIVYISFIEIIAIIVIMELIVNIRVIDLIEII